ncbi:agmatinase [Brumimicrobium aurantiacum]|uniref:Agmatinase n=1 Tax=Brumimicrobium aurantiacum TaxID=1737063 RepID=A0A3E1EUA8_9FLAO|nr:agmatinase [Brumimicrobium aurantiacum]RFC53149.1 agmatinase [Brumimicrobium aurantiacum]
MRTFAGIPEELGKLENAAVVIIPVPYDGTSTYGKGADIGFEALMDASENMELYDIETNTVVYEKGIFITSAVTEESSPEAMCEAVEKTTDEYIETGKFVCLFGGEHSISIGAIRSFKKKYENLSVLQLDAHSDLRPEYNGSACNHACALHEASKNTNLVQVGIRSMDAVELPFVKKENFFDMYRINSTSNWMDEVINQLGDEVYLTIDLDIFDPSIMPSTGTPEPGGLYWYDVITLVRRVVEEKSLVGFDIVELAPVNGVPAPDFMAAKLLYKILSYKFNS